MKRCDNRQNAPSLAAREVGCPLTHCAQMHHIDEATGLHWDGTSAEECNADPSESECTCTATEIRSEDDLCPSCLSYAQDEAVRRAERAAGWDPTP